MNQFSSQPDECFIVVKAQPHRSSKYSETVCCAGVGRDGKWRRQYPVPFRILNDHQQFKRWQWIEYSYTASKYDRRTESQKVDPESLQVTGELKKSERASFLNPLIRESFADANARGESLTLLRPQTLKLSYEEKPADMLASETRKHAELAAQSSLFDRTAKPLKPCPYQFFVRWKDHQGKSRRHECDDWETSSAFFNFRSRYGEQLALRYIAEKYEDQYFKAGIALAFSTHSRRNVTYGGENQWLLVGLIRIDEDTQSDMFLG